MTQGRPKRAAEVESLAGTSGEILSRLLDELAEHEKSFTERFYDIFFDRRPDARPLFGVHAIAEREEMMRETFHSLHAWLEQEPWLEGNLTALGRSHWEYGVTADMYDSFVDAMIECGREVLGDFVDDEKARVFRTALEAVAEPMRCAGDRAAALHDERSPG